LARCRPVEVTTMRMGWRRCWMGRAMCCWTPGRRGSSSRAMTRMKSCRPRCSQKRHSSRRPRRDRPEAALGLDLVLLEAGALRRYVSIYSKSCCRDVVSTYPADGQIVCGDSCGKRGRGDDGLGQHFDSWFVVVKASDCGELYELVEARKECVL